MLRALIAALLSMIPISSFAAKGNQYVELPDGQWLVYTPEQMAHYVKADRDYCGFIIKTAIEADPQTPQEAEKCLSKLAYGTPVGAGSTLFAPSSDEYSVSDDRVHRLITRLFINDRPDAAFSGWLAGILAHYQWFHGLPPTGNLDAETVATLDRNVRHTSVPADSARVRETPPPETDRDPPRYIKKKRSVPRLITPKKFPFEREASKPQPKAAEAADPPAQAARPAAQERAPPAHEPDHAATIDLRSAAQISMALTVVFLAVRGRPLIDWTFSRVIPAARSGDFLGLLRSLSQSAIDMAARLAAFLQGSRLVPKAAGLAGGLVAYFL